MSGGKRNIASAKRTRRLSAPVDSGLETARLIADLSTQSRFARSAASLAPRRRARALAPALKGIRRVQTQLDRLVTRPSRWRTCQFRRARNAAGSTSSKWRTKPAARRSGSSAAAAAHATSCLGV